ncbi:hypothetical protein BDR05DRAFT_1005910 [Suillus weaverae]|nr:hypothetical protein BDR05DRAFT_1005910 [Suillus weaverae]
MLATLHFRLPTLQNQSLQVGLRSHDRAGCLAKQWRKRIHRLIELFELWPAMPVAVLSPMAGDTGLYNLSEDARKMLQCSNSMLAAFIVFCPLITALALNFTSPEINKKIQGLDVITTMATSRKVASKHAKSKDTQPVQPPTRTTSGQQRRPTEKETYHVSESQHVTHRQENKEKKLEKQKKKALRATYEANPNGFEQEPSELHSDIDREEETMFSDCDMPSKLSQSKPKVLTYSAGKIPPVLHNTSATRKATTTAPTPSPSDDESTDSDSQPEAQVDHTDEEDDNGIAEELSPIA